jgi:DTW domain-containing protein YfiP
MDPAVVPVTRAARARCTACELPLAACVCALVERVDNAVDVLVLQHPREAREAKNSARLLRLGLARCRVVVGDVFDPIDLESRLHAPGRCSVLLYPDGAAGPPSPRLDAAPTQLVVLDGTWRKSRRMLLENPSLRQLPRLSLRPAAQSRYRVLRKARLATQLSTLEATCAALAHLEGDEARYAPLLRAFDRFVEDRAGRAARAPAGPE